MPRGIPNDPAAYQRKLRRWARFGNIGRLRMADVAARTIASNPFYSEHTRHQADDLLMRLAALRNAVAYENKTREDTISD